MKNCKECESEFLPKRSDAKYCSSFCRDNFNNRKKQVNNQVEFDGYDFEEDNSKMIEEIHNTQVNYPSSIDYQGVINDDYLSNEMKLDEEEENMQVDNLNFDDDKVIRYSNYPSKKIKKKKEKKKKQKKEAPKDNLIRDTGLVALVGFGLYQIFKK